MTEHREKTMRRYAVFSGPECYPSGGMKDLIGTYDGKEEAITEATGILMDGDVPDGVFDWAHVYDMEAMEIVWEG